MQLLGGGSRIQEISALSLCIIFPLEGGSLSTLPFHLHLYSLDMNLRKLFAPLSHYAFRICFLANGKVEKAPMSVNERDEWGVPGGGGNDETMSPVHKSADVPWPLVTNTH